MIRPLRYVLLPSSCGLSCLSVCWSREWAVIKRLNRSRCCLRFGLRGPRNHVFSGARILHGKGYFWRRHAGTSPGMRAVDILNVMRQAMRPLATSLLEQLLKQVSKFIVKYTWQMHMFTQDIIIIVVVVVVIMIWYVLIRHTVVTTLQRHLRMQSRDVARDVVGRMTLSAQWSITFERRSISGYDFTYHWKVTTVMKNGEKWEQ